MAEEILIRQGAPTLAGIKTGSLFPCPCEDHESLMTDIRKLNRRLSPKGLCLLPIRFLPGQALLYLVCESVICTETPDDAALEKDFASIREQLEAGELTEEQADRLRGEAVDRLLARQAEEYGRMQPGETPAREITLPRRTDGKTKVSRTVRTILEGKATPELALPGIKQLVAEGAFS